MNNSDKKQKLKKIAIISAAIFFGVFIILIMISQRPQTAGKGNVSASDYNDRIDYRDEMNCRIGGKKDESGFTVAAKDGWSEVAIKNYDLNGQKVQLHMVGEKLYVNRDGDLKIYNVDYFNHEFSQNFPDSLMLSEGDSRKIHCTSQETSDYIIEKQRDYEDLSWKQVENEEAK